MAERCVKGDYIGFTFGGVHSSELGLMRVSNGSRYEQDLLPPLQDKTAQVNGRDGAVYFGSQYNTRPIKVPVAFDNMTEESFNQLKRLLQDKKPKYLWFDETPYKQWLVKTANVQNFKWVCFDESQNIARENDGDPISTKKRIYKGEGTLEFNCFSPYAENRGTFLDQSIDEIKVWSSNKTPKKLIRLQKDKYYSGYPFYYKTTSTKDLYNSAEKGMSLSHPSTDDLPKNSFACLTSRPLNSSNGNITVFFDQKSILYVSAYCFYFNKGFFTNYDNFYESHMLNWYDFSNGNEVNSSSIGPFPKSVQSLVDEMHNGSTYTKKLYLIMTPRGNIYPVIQKPEQITSNIGYVSIYDPTNKTYDYYYYDKNYPVTISFIKDITLDYNYNFSEWEKISHFCHFRNEWYEQFNIFSSQYGAYLYNAGDRETPINIYYIDEETKQFPGCELALCRDYNDWEVKYFNEGYLELKPFNFIGEDVGFIIDSKIKMIKGIDKDQKPTGTNYNKYIKSGDFFKLPPSPVFDINDYSDYYEYCICDSREPVSFDMQVLPGFKKVEYKYYYI